MHLLSVGKRLAVLLLCLASAIEAMAGPAKGLPKVMVASQPAATTSSASAPSGSIAASGVEYSVTGNQSGDQTFPQAAVGPAGGCLVWVDNGVTTNGLRIRAVGLDGSFNPSGSAYLVSSAAASKATGDQENPQVAVLKNGTTVFVWQGGVKGSQQIYIRYRTSAGKWIANDTRVSAQNKYNQVDPKLAVLNDGSVEVVWSSFGQDGSRQGIFSRHFSATGGPVAAEFQVNQFTLNNQRTPSITTLANGNFVVAWVSELQKSISGVDIYARIFGPTGKAVTSEFPVDMVTNQPCANPYLCASPMGGFMVAWSQNANVVSTIGTGFGIPVAPANTGYDTDSWDVFARIYSSAGAPAGNAVRVNTYVPGRQYAPRVSASGTDYFVVWTSVGQAGPSESVYGQLLSNSGTLEGSETQVNTSTLSRQIQPANATDGTGRYLAVWSSFSASDIRFHLLAQVFQSVAQ